MLIPLHHLYSRAGDPAMTGRAVCLVRSGEQGAYSYNFVPDDEVYDFNKG